MVFLFKTSPVLIANLLHLNYLGCQRIRGLPHDHYLPGRKVRLSCEVNNISLVVKSKTLVSDRLRNSTTAQ